MTTAPRRVLIVEDDQSQQRMYQKALRYMEFDTECAASPAEARKSLAGGPFAVMILDLQLGGAPSLEFFEEVRERFPAVSVVIATGHGSFEIARKTIHRDVVDFLAKPIPLSELEVALDRAWSRHVLVQTPVAKLLPSRPIGPVLGDDADGACAAFLANRRELRLDSMERELIREALRRSNDSRKAAADLLGISERKLYYRLTQYRTV